MTSKNKDFNNKYKRTRSKKEEAPPSTDSSTEIKNESYHCLLLNFPSVSIFATEGVNLTHLLDSLKKLKYEAESLCSLSLSLDCLSIREPYHKIGTTVNGVKEQGFCGDFEKYRHYFSLNAEYVATHFFGYPSKLSMPIVSENVRIFPVGHQLRLQCDPGYEKELEIVNESMFVENSMESVIYFSDERGLKNKVFERYEQFCVNAINSVFPLPEELSSSLYSDTVNIPPSDTSPTNLWTFLLFNMAWKQHPYISLRAKYASDSGCGQFVFVGDNRIYTIELVRNLNRLFIKQGTSIIPMQKMPIDVNEIVSAIENVFSASFDAINLLIRQIEELLNPRSMISNHNTRIEDRHLHIEKTFCLEIMQPLLESMGFRKIRYTHGTNEFGKDFVAVDNDNTHEFYVAFVIKVGNVSGSASSKPLLEIKSQISSALKIPYTIPETMDKVFMGKVIVAISGKFLDNAKTILQANYKKVSKRGWLEFWDGVTINDYIKKYGIKIQDTDSSSE